MNTIKGSVEKIFYNNASFYILSIKVNSLDGIDNDKLNPQYPFFITVVGNMQGVIEEGYVIECEGDWEFSEKSPNWPWQYKIFSSTVLEAETPKTVKTFLASLQGIGPATANLIFEKYGMKTYSIIEEDAITGQRRLTTIKGITPQKEDIIIASYKEKRLYKNVSSLLSKYNIGKSKIDNIIRMWGEETVEVLKENPYNLSNEKFVSFRVADTFAFDNDVAFDSANRIEAAIKNVLDNKASSLGHVFLETETAISMTLKTLEKEGFIKGDIDKLFIESHISDFIKEGKFVEEEGRLYLKYRYNNEEFCAQKLVHRSKLPSLFTDASEELIEECVEEAQKQLKVTLASGQKNAVITAIHNTTTIITGGPGTGKTTTLKVLMYSMDLLCEKLGREPLNKTLAAPTGMAAKRMKEATNMDASTIHRLLEFAPFGAGGEVKAKNEEDPIVTDMLIIDESSMLDIDLFALLLHAVQDNTELIFLGDIDQLPSVGPGDVLHDVIDSEVIAVARLTQTYRQGAQSPILGNAKKINTGDTDLILDKTDEFRFIEIPDSEEDIECDAMAEMALRVFYEEYVKLGGDISKIQVLLPMRNRTKVSVDQINPLLQELVNPIIDSKREMVYGNTRFRKGDKVQQKTNNYDKWTFNGDVGIITEIAPKGEKLKVDFGEVVAEYQRDELDQLSHSFATTIHKSQGSEYQTIIMVFTSQHELMLQRNLIYTGLTRAKKKAIIIGDRSALDFGIGNVSNRQRNSMLKEKMQKKNCQP